MLFSLLVQSYLQAHQINIKMSANNNLSLYIKRAEVNHTKEFIMDAFSINNIGKVCDVRFIKKVDTNGRDYNGTVVMFERWNMNAIVKQILDEMSASKDGTTKFTFDRYKGRYWFINIYKTQFPEYEEITSIDSGLPEKERIAELENLVKSMAAQMHYMQTRQEKTEMQLMETEHTNTQISLFNMELKSQVEEAEREKKWFETKMKKEVEKVKFEYDMLKNHNTYLDFVLEVKQKECDELKQCIYDDSCIMNYVQGQAIEMRNILETDVFDESKLTLEELM